MAQSGYITPDNLPPGDYLCRRLIVPNDLQYLEAVKGALLDLTEEWNWEQISGIAPQQAATAFWAVYNRFTVDDARFCRMLGEIICFAAAAAPDPNWLACDGASLLRADYPDLFAVIGVTFGSADGTHFTLPDLRSRVALMAGTGTGLSAYAIGDATGEETHTLTTAETASHTHTDVGHTHVEGIAIPAVGAALVGVPIPSSIPGVGVTGAGNANIANSGGGGPHNNIQPVLALNFFIVATENL